MSKPPVILALAVAAATTLLAAPLGAGDWPEWRGPARNGVAPDSPRLADSWPAEGPRRLWQSEFIPADDRGNLSSPVVADGRVYVHANWRYAEPIATRTLSEDQLERLRREPAANPDSVATLEKIKGRQFPGQDELERWLAANGITGRMRTLTMKYIPISQNGARDVLVCLDAASGRTLWKAEFPGRHEGAQGSSTPCVAGGRCYFAGSRQTVYCVDAKTGDLVWSARTPRGDKIASSFLVADGVAVVLAKELTALSARSGDLLWTQPALRGETSSPALWRHDGKAYAVVNTYLKIACVDLATGKIAWAVPGLRGENSSPAIVGDRMAVTGSDGLGGFRLSAGTAEKLWTVDRVQDNSASPLFIGGQVYVTNSRTVCVDFASGRVEWEARQKGYVSSPLAADGKIIGTNEEEVFMFKAAPEAYTPLGCLRLNMLHCASPAFADGRLFVRLEDSVVCFDLRAP